MTKDTDLNSRPFLIRRIAKWLQKSPESDDESILEGLQAVQGKHDYADVLLVDPKWRLLKNLTGENNDLHHRPNSALNLRIPLSRTDLTSVMAVLGKEGIVEGRDYRNIKVLSVIQSVPVWWLRMRNQSWNSPALL